VPSFLEFQNDFNVFFLPKISFNLGSIINVDNVPCLFIYLWIRKTPVKVIPKLIPFSELPVNPADTVVLVAVVKVILSLLLNSTTLEFTPIVVLSS
jgi:hypothetical protein